jgi:hypothetical protein
VANRKVVELALNTQVTFRLVGLAQPWQFEVQGMSVIAHDAVMRDERFHRPATRRADLQLVAVPPCPQGSGAKITAGALGQLDGEADQATRR